MRTKTIAVHGATGSQGGPVAAALNAAGHHVRPLTRAAGTDLLDPHSLEAAYAGVDAVVLHLPLVYDERVLSMAGNARRALEAQGVPQLVLNTGGPIPPVPVGVPFVDARHLAAGAELARVTVLKPTTYLENLSTPWSAERIARDGVVEYPRPAGAPVQWVATADVAAAAARAIADGITGSFDLPGRALTGDELAAALGEALGRDVRFAEISPAEFGERLRPHLGDHAAYGTAAAYESFAADPPPLSPPSAFPGWSPRDVAAWARQVAWPAAVAA